MRVAASVVLVVVLADACSSATDKAGGRKPEHVLTLHVLNTRGEEEIAPFLDRLGELSGGGIRLDVENKWEWQNPSADADVIKAMQANKADLAVVPARAWHAVGVTSFDALIAPFAIDSMALQAKVLTSDVAADMLPAVEKLGLKGLGILPGPMRRPAGITKTLKGPDDFAGARIGYFPSAVAEKTLKTLRAVPVGWAAGGTSVSGFDGVEAQVTAVPQYVHVMRSVTANVALWPRPNVVVATAKAYQSLTEQQRSWLHSALRDAVAPIAQSELHIDEDLGILCRNAHFRFVTASADELAALHAAVSPVDAWLRKDADTERYLDQIAALRNSVTPYPDEQPSCAGLRETPQPPAAATPFDGTYRMVTPADCDPAPENCGTWTFYFDRGRFAITQENGAACTWGYGTYQVSGDRVEWLFTDGGGAAPTNAQNEPGEDFVYTWSVYKNRTTLSAVPGAISPAPFLYRPWLRLSAKPDPAYLSNRCPPPAGALPN